METLNLAIPSRGNPDGLRRCVNSALALAAHPERVHLHIHFSDDEASFRFCPQWPRTTKFYSNKREYYYAEANELFVKLPNGWFVWTDDDSEFVKFGWDEVLLDAATAVDGAVVEFFPGEMKHFIAHTEFFRGSHCGGLLYPEGFTHFCGDSARAHDLRKYGRIRHLPTNDPSALILTHPMMASTHPEMLLAREKFWNQDRRALEEYIRERS